MELAATRRKGHSPRSADPSWAAIPSGRAWFHQQKHASDAFNAHNRAGRGGLVHRTVASIARQVRNACFAGNFPARRLMQPYAVN